MKLFRDKLGGSGRFWQRRAMTLVEIMVSTAIFGMVVTAFVVLQMFALRQNQLVESKLGASDQSRTMLQKMGMEIRSAKKWEVGNVNSSGTTFSEIADGQPQRGTAIRIMATANTNNFVQYYFLTNSRVLMRSLSGVTGADVVAQELTNTMVFQAEDYRGTVQTAGTGLWRNCIRVILEFAQYQYPLTRVGPGYLYDYYKMEFRISPHCPSAY
jgi:prepilin-type N-terminal cleavage/methylation domain-containing protein